MGVVGGAIQWIHAPLELRAAPRPPAAFLRQHTQFRGVALENREHGLFSGHIGLGDEIAGPTLFADRFQAPEMGQQLGGARFGGAASHLSEALDLAGRQAALLSALIR